MMIQRPGPILIGISTIAALALTSCGSNGGDDDGDINLRFMWWGSDHRHALTEEIIDLFEEENPHITIETEYGGFDDHWDSLATQTAGGQAPDIFQMDEQYLREYADRDALLELDGVDVSDFEETAVENGMVEDSLYAVTMGINAQILVANPVVFDEAGVDIPDDETWTWDDFAATITALNEGLEDGYGFGGPGGNGMFQTWVRQQGQHISTEDGELGFGVEHAVGYFEFLDEVMNQEGAPSAELLQEQSNVPLEQGLAATGQAAFATFWTNEAVFLTEAVGNELELLRYPSHTGQAADAEPWYKSSMYLSASANTDYPEEVQEFIDFFVNSEEAAMVNLVERGIPPNTEIQDLVMDELDGVEADTVEYIQEIEDDLGEPEPVTAAGLSDLTSVLGRYTDELYFGRMDPQEAAEAFVAELESSVGEE
ncbi:ABC transporter substrate-binding protein [Nesterenkonia alba]|uniref:ABC transporter substrate-binding protein n=1 Tax=Nesterenkonia alba TaxID=515814 RepID=UPI0003B4C347|nr:ABC transporter substrate-binding protein [Nesterenkonia alba]